MNCYRFLERILKKARILEIRAAIITGLLTITSIFPQLSYPKDYGEVFLLHLS